MAICLNLLKRPAPILWLVLWASPVFSMGEVYQWTDSTGVIHFTDDYEAVPEPLRGSPHLIIRKDFHVGGYLTGTTTVSETSRQRPVPEPKTAARPTEPEPVKVVPQVIVHSQQFTTIVVVNSFVTRPKKRSCLVSRGCRAVFRRNFKNRSFIHPSVFSGGSRQYIHPGSFH